MIGLAKIATFVIVFVLIILGANIEELTSYILNFRQNKDPLERLEL